MVEVIIPFAGGCPHRERALDWVRGRYRWPVTVATAPGGPWCKAAAVMPAVSNSSADVVVVADADAWCDGVESAVRTAQTGAPWCIPHRLVKRLSEIGTGAVLAGAHWREQALAERPYQGMQGGGIVVAHREVLLSVPMDPRFVGWGQEDTSWAIALHCLVGPAWRGNADLVHLWHPPQPRATRRRGSMEGWRLYRRYARAIGNPNAMRALLNEIGGDHAAGGPAEPAVHDHAA
jgi:hypothetical protein